MEQEKGLQPRQKVITILLRTYSEAISKLKQRNFSQGINSLQSLLSHPYINDSDMQNLRFSIFMSLGEVNEPLGFPMLSVGYYWQALKLHQKRSQLMEQKQIKNRLQNQEKSDDEFTILLKMILIVEKTHHREELTYLLKRAIKISPSVWRENLLQKLLEVYQKEGKVQCIKDLKSFVTNPIALEEAINEISQIQNFKIQQSQLISSEVQNETNCLKKLCLRVNLQQKDEIMLKYSSWQNLLTMIYVLLKCKHTRNFNKKKYLHKKYDESDRDWNQFLNLYSLTKTKIEIKVIQMEEGVQKIEIQGQSNVIYDKMVNDLSDELLKYKYGKKKGKKQINSLQQLSRLPSFTAKDPKKILSTQTKSIYGSIYEYYKQLITKSSINKHKLKYLSQFNQGLFNKIFSRILNDEVIKEKGQAEQNEDQEMEGSMSVPHEPNQTQKDVREKKASKTKKLQLIERNKLISLSVIPVLRIDKQSQSKQYSNVIQLLHELVQSLFNDKSDQRSNLLKNMGIRSILQKDVLKVLELGQGFFQNIRSVQFFDFLMDKLQNVIDKDCKNKQFKSHQLNKRNVLAEHIKHKYLPSTLQIQDYLTSDMSLQTLKTLANLCENLCRFYSFYQMSSPTQVSFYKQLYIVLKKKHEILASHKQFNQKQRQRAISYYIEKEIQKHQKKAMSKTTAMIIKDEKQESLNTVDQIYKKDQEVSAVLPLMKIFNCHPQQSKMTKAAQIPQQNTAQIYLQAFVKLSQLFFKKIELQSYKQFNSRLLNLLGQIMKLKQVVNYLHDKFLQPNLFKSSVINNQLYVQTLYYLVRIYLLNLYQQSENCLKNCFQIISLLFKNEKQHKKFILIPKIIYSFDELIKFKKFKPETLNSIRKRLYQNLILKYLNYIYNSPLFPQNQEKNVKRPQLKNKMEEQLPMNSQEKRLKAIEQQHEDIKERIFDLIHDVYFCPEKDKEFNPKKIEEAVGYFMYLLNAYHEMFQRKIIQLQNEAIKVFRKCYKLYLQKRDQVYRLCDKVQKFKNDFQLFMNGQDHKIDRKNFISTLKQEIPICECCSSLVITHKFYTQSLFVIGKYFESQCAQPELYFTKESWVQDSDKDEMYYFEYLALNLQKQLAWQNILRVNCLKSFYYFDSLLGQPYQKYKNKFLYTKRLIHLVNDHFPMFQGLTPIGSASIEILNILKIKERQLLMLTKKIKIGGVQNKESKELQLKYKQGMKKILTSSQKYIAEDVRVRYLRLSQLKIKMLWANIQKDLKQDKLHQQVPVIIELDDDSNDSKAIHKPSKNISQIQQLIDQAKLLIKDILSQQTTQHVSHLEEDICMQLYVLLAKHLQLKLDNSINAICSSIGSAHSQKYKKIKQAEFYLSDLNYTLGFFENGEFLTNNPKYCLKNQNIVVIQEDFANIRSIFASIFSKNQALEQKNILRESQKAKQSKKRPIIVINDEQNEQVVAQPQRERISEQIVRSQSKQKSVSSKGNAKRKILKLQIGTYIYDKIVQYIINRKLYQQPLNHLQAFLNCHKFQQIALKMTSILNEMSRVIMELPKYQLKKHRNRRSVVLSLLYCSHLAIKYTKNAQKPLEIIKQHVTMKSELITNLNLYNDKLCAQKNQLLADFYNRSIVHHIMKIQFIRHLFEVYTAQDNKEALVLLIKKLLKLSKVNQAKPEKQKVQKNVQKAAMSLQGQQGKKVKEAKQRENEVNLSKQSKESVGAKPLEVQIWFYLFCEGASIFMQILKKQAENGEIDEKYEKNLLEFRNKMKKQIKPEQRNMFLLNLQMFLSQYQEKYNKKIKMKKVRKDKQGEILPIIQEKCASLQPFQRKQEYALPINFQFLKVIEKIKPEKSRKSSSQKQEEAFEVKQSKDAKLKRKILNKAKESTMKSSKKAKSQTQINKIQKQQPLDQKQVSIKNEIDLNLVLSEKSLSKSRKQSESKKNEASRQKKHDKAARIKKQTQKVIKQQSGQTPVKKKSKQL